MLCELGLPVLVRLVRLLALLGVTLLGVTRPRGVNSAHRDMIWAPAENLVRVDTNNARAVVSTWQASFRCHRTVSRKQCAHRPAVTHIVEVQCAHRPAVKNPLHFYSTMCVTADESSKACRVMHTNNRTLLPNKDDVRDVGE